MNHLQVEGHSVMLRRAEPLTIAHITAGFSGHNVIFVICASQWSRAPELGDVVLYLLLLYSLL